MLIADAIGGIWQPAHEVVSKRGRLWGLPHAAVSASPHADLQRCTARPDGMPFLSADDQMDYGSWHV